MKIKFFPFYAISILPMPVLYLLSDILYIIVFYILKYRRSVVLENLTRSFPDKSEQEIKQIEKKFYKHFCDVMVETFKGLTISKKEIKKRMQIKNLDLIHKYYNENKSILLYCAHQGNWEWLTYLSIFIPHKGTTLYQQISNSYFDELMKHIRERYGTMCIEVNQGYRTILKFTQQEQPMMMAVLGDQSPAKDAGKYWGHFLNQETAFLAGVDRIAIKTGMVVLFPAFKRIKRGYYELEFKTVETVHTTNGSNQIIDKYANVLEETIKHSPEMWLWSHRRWKLTESYHLQAS